MKKRPTKAQAPRKLRGVGSKHPPPKLEHLDVLSVLDYFIDSEAQGQDARALFPRVAAHLAACETCRSVYEQLAELHTQESAPESYGRAVREDTSNVYAVEPAPAEQGWTRHVQSRVGGAPLGMRIVIQPQLLKRALSPGVASSTLRGADHVDRVLLVQDTVPLGRRQVMVEVRAIRTQLEGNARGPDSALPSPVRLWVSVTSTEPLPEPLRVTLTYAEHQVSGFVRGGTFTSEPIPVTELEEADGLDIKLEAGPGSFDIIE